MNEIFGGKRYMFKKKLLSLALAGSIGFATLASPVLIVSAAPETISEFDSLISELTSEQNEVSSKVTALQQEIRENEEEAELLVAEMEETAELLETIRAEIEQLKVLIAQREEHLDEQARALQIMGESSNLIHFVLNAESLNDVIGRVDVVTTLIQQNKKTVEQQEADKALVEEKEVETVEKQEEQTTLAAKLESNKSLLEEKKAEQESMLAQIAAEKAVAQTDRDALVARAQAAEQRRLELQTVRTASSSAVAASSTTATSSSSSVSTPAPAPAPSVSSGSVLGIAHSLTGVPYYYGGTTTSGFDCSGFTSYVFARAGRSLPRTAAGQYSGTTRVSRSQAQPGDLVFFNVEGGINHVGIYLGGGSFIGSQSHTGVAVSQFNSGYWASKVVGFGR